VSTVLPSPALPPHPSVSAALHEPMRFGDFPITETQSFPPPARAQCWVYVTLNAEIALSLPESPVLQQFLPSPRLRVSVDGQWLWWALRRKYPDRPLRKLSGSDLIHELAALCAANGERLLLLGSNVQANARAVQQLRARWPGLDVAGLAPGHFVVGADSERAVHAQALAAMADYRPHYVVLGLGALKEQRLAASLLPELDGRVHGLLCFGGAIDLASGLVRRAPRVWQRMGLECVYRVVQQPERLPRLWKMLRLLPLLALARY
jgi:N-acetylglucosaminyldiphosphoundecaprenol N-acetyl-beta-D-mannosaminyltransferase